MPKAEDRLRNIERNRSEAPGEFPRFWAFIPTHPTPLRFAPNLHCLLAFFNYHELPGTVGPYYQARHLTTLRSSLEPHAS